MKKILITIILFLGFIPNITISCAVPPDILHEFRFDLSGTKINYSLSIWQNLHPILQENWKKNSNTEFSNENLEKILEKEIIQNSKFWLNNKNIDLQFLTGSIISNPENLDPSIPPVFIQAEFEINQNIDFSKKNNIRLEFDKTSQIEISPLIHPFLTVDFQKWTAKYYVVNQHDRTFDVFENNWTEFVINNFLEENYYQNNFEIIFEKLNDNYTNPHKKIETKNNIIFPDKIQQNQNNNLNVKNLLEKFFSEKNSILLQIFGIIIAIFAWMLHGLLPGHSKAILGTYIFSNSTGRKKEIFTLISSTAISHTIFIFVLATIILALQKGTWATSLFAKNITAIIYIIFGIFFIYQAVKNFWNKNFLINKNSLNHQENCNCEIHKNIFKKTFWTGIIAWANPCIDALVLFIFAITIGNIGYAILLILSFSIGIGLMLGIIAFFITKWKFLLNKKSEFLAEKINNYLTLFAGIFIIASGIWYLIW